MGSKSVRCRVCGHEVDSDLLRDRYAGACPNCLGSFALEGLQAAPAPAPSGGEFGKFLLAERLGKGGMGEVWKAFDKNLKRWVALKFLREQNSRDLARFQREASTAAGLAHPGIAAIHEVGELEGRHFIAMQYVEGRTMQAFPRENRKLLIRLMRDAARALEHAHQRGVIHRDLKPENLLVEESGEGLRLVILDFGLARPIEGGERLSKSGTVVGTLGYMSPEQAKGAKLDERADLYSLGATLYEILTGKPPFEGTNFYEVLKKIEVDEPVAPRRINPRIAPDLETIVLKCLEKDRERRYGSAKDLADDLDRFLEGDAILARRPSTIYRLRMTLAKRKSVLAIATAAVLLAAALGWRLLVASPATEYATRYAAATVSWAEARGLAMAGLDPAGIRNRAKIAREAFERAIEAGDEAQAHLMRGKCLQLEGKDDEALKALERAQELDPANAETRVELAKALFWRYLASRGTPRTDFFTEGPDSKPWLLFGDLPSETSEQKGCRERGERLMAGVEAAPAQEYLLKGLLAFGKGDYRQASESFAAYSKSESWDAQALRLEGGCRYFDGDLSAAVAAFDLSLKRVLHADGLLWRGRTYVGKGLHDEAIADFNEAIKLNPKHAQAYSYRAIANTGKGLLDEAIADCTRAIELNRKYAPTYYNRGNAMADKGLHDEAIADYTAAIALDPNDSQSYTNRGLMKLKKGLCDDAIADYTKAIELDPKNLVAYNNRGSAKIGKRLYDEAVADCTKAIELDSKYARAYVNRGTVKRAKGLYDEALADFDAAIKLDPKFAAAYVNRGALWNDVKRLHDRAIEDFDKAIELDPMNSSAYQNRGIAKSAKGLHDEAIADCTKAVGLNPSPAAYNCRGNAMAKKGLHDEAIADFTKAIGLDPKDALPFVNRGNVKRKKGLYGEANIDFTKALELDSKNVSALNGRGIILRSQGRLDEAIAEYSKALEADPTDASAYANRGAVYHDKRWHDEAIQDFTKAIELDPKNVIAYCNRGVVNRDKGRHEEAIADFTKAIELEPKSAFAFIGRGIAKSKRKLNDEAIADFTKAIELDPNNAGTYSDRGALKRDKGLPDEAIDDYNKAIALDPRHAGAYNYRGMAMYDKGLYDSAIDDYTKAIALDPRFANAFHNRAHARIKLGDNQVALADCKEALAVAPQGWFARAEVERHLKEYAVPLSEQAQAERVFGAANKLYDKKEYRKAIEGYMKVIESAARIELRIDAAYDVACCHALLGEKKDALEWLQKAVEMGWKDADHIEKDSDLESLRGEDRYKKLMARLQGK